MTHTRSLVTLSLASCLLAACGTSVDTGAGGSAGTGGSTSTTGTGASTGTTTSTGTGGSPATGDCATDAECGDGTCVELTPGGYQVCLSHEPEATACTTPGGPIPDDCCNSAECGAGGKCFASTNAPYCGGVPMPDHNICLTDACTTDVSCQAPGGPPNICAPAGAFGNPMRTCVTAYCHTNADCTAKPGGACRPVSDPCCGQPQGLACVYPGGCHDDNACSPNGNSHCEIDPGSKSGVCKPGLVGCPA